MLPLVIAMLVLLAATIVYVVPPLLRDDAVQDAADDRTAR